MGELIEPLTWDTEFFGTPMAAVDLDGASPATLAAIDEEARDLGVACLVGALDPHRSTSARLVQDHGHDLVEASILFARPPGPFEAPPTEARARPGTVDDLPALEPCIDVLVPWSRFAVDPRFGPDEARRLFRAWARRAATCEDDHFQLSVAETDDGIVGFSTHTRSPFPRVDLMGVTEKGSGSSRALMALGLDWGGRDGAFEAGPCATRNLAVLRYLEHCGFHAERTRYTFHRWYDAAA